MKITQSDSTPIVKRLRPCGFAIIVGVLILLCQPTHAGTVVAWGNNTWGQSTVPADLTNAIAIAAGWQQSLALKADGTVVGWGGAQNGLKFPPAGLNNVIGISLGASNGLALKADGSVVGWGTNNFGAVSFPPGLTNLVAVCGGFVDNLVLRPDGTLLSWGRTPGLVVAQTNVVLGSQFGRYSTFGGFTHNLALGTDGKVLAWGDNSSGQCNVPADLTNAIAVAAGGGFSLAVRADGTVVSWGNPTSTNVPADATNVVGLAVGGSHRMALRADGTVVSWGSITTVPAGLTNVMAIAAGVSHCLALVGNGPPILQAAATGFRNASGQPGVAIPTQSGRVYALEQSSSLTGTNWTAVSLAPGNGSSQMLTDPDATNTASFYRVRQW